MIPRFRPPHTVRDLGVLFTRKTAGDSIAEFETSFAEVAGQSYARVFPYGRTALVAVLEYLKEHSDPTKSEVICPSYTCVVVAHAIVEAGLQPVFVDCEEETLNMDWSFVHQAVSNSTLAVISTSLFGNPVKKADIDEFRLRFPSLPIIQDCAHSFFAGSAHQEGIAAIYGLNVSKLVTTIFGGMVSTDDPNLSEWLTNYQARRLKPARHTKRFFRSLYLVGSLLAFSRPVYWFTFLLQRVGLLTRFVSYYRPDSIEFPDDAYSQIGVVEAELGRRQIAKYNDEIQRRVGIANIYRRLLSTTSSLSVVNYGDASTYSHFVTKTVFANQVERQMRWKFCEIGRIVDYDVSSLPAYASSAYFGSGTSRKSPQEVLNLPIHRGVSPLVAKKVATKLISTLRSVEAK